MKATVINCKFSVKNGVVTCVLITNEMSNKVFIGKAICSPKDNFDIITGKHLAESRAKLKYYRHLRLKCKNLLDEYKNFISYIDECKEGYDKFTYLINTEEEHIKNIIND